MKDKLIILTRKMYLNQYNFLYIFSNLNNLYKFLKISWIEGNSQDSPEQTKYLHNISKNKNNILEIGFNAGHSSEIFLNSNKNSKVTSVDEGSHDYIEYGFNYLSRKFKNRLTLHIIDSAKIKSAINKKEIFDLIFIDGFHSYEYAKNDILNCHLFANRETIVILDDLDDPEVSKAWNEFVEENYIEVIEEIRYSGSKNKAMGVGRYIFTE